MEMEKDTYLARTLCLNCGRRNYPAWQEIKKGVEVGNVECNNCGLKRLVPEPHKSGIETDDVGKTNES